VHTLQANGRGKAADERGRSVALRAAVLIGRRKIERAHATNTRVGGLLSAVRLLLARACCCAGMATWRNLIRVEVQLQKPRSRRRREYKLNFNARQVEGRSA